MERGLRILQSTSFGIRQESPMGSATEVDKQQDAAEKPAGKPSGRRRFVLVSGIAAVIVLATGAAVAVSAVRDSPVQEVLEQSGAGSERVPGSETVDTGRSDLQRYIESIYPDDLPLPQGYDRESVVATVTALNASNAGLTQSIGLTHNIESVAYCAWVDQWLAADTLGDRHKRDEAAEVMTESLTWNGYTATDGGGVMEAQRSFADGAAAGDRHLVQKAHNLNSCDQLSATAK